MNEKYRGEDAAQEPADAEADATLQGARDDMERSIADVLDIDAGLRQILGDALPPEDFGPTEQV